MELEKTLYNAVSFKMKLKLDLEVGEGREEVGLEGGQLVTTQYQLLQSLIL